MCFAKINFFQIFFLNHPFSNMNLKSMKNVLENSHHIEEEFLANLIHYATRNGDIKILNFLIIKCGINPLLRSNDLNGYLPTHEAASLGNVETLEWLLKMTNLSLMDRDYYGHTYLHIAAR